MKTSCIVSCPERNIYYILTNSVSVEKQARIATAIALNAFSWQPSGTEAISKYQLIYTVDPLLRGHPNERPTSLERPHG